MRWHRSLHNGFALAAGPLATDMTFHTGSNIWKSLIL
jgi:hypothetical protein